MCDEEVASFGAQAHTGAGVVVRQHAGYARFAYNWAVGEFKAGLDVGEWLADQTLRPRWNVVKGIIAPGSVPSIGVKARHPF